MATTNVYDPTSQALVRIDHDYDADGRVDVRTFMKDGRPVRLEGDADGDGRNDRWEYYDPAGQLLRVGGSTRGDGVEDTWALQAAGPETHVELSTRRDGRVDRHEYFVGDVLGRAEADRDGDGALDTWEQYENGRLAVLLVDEAGTTGRPTRRLVYQSGGVARLEIDPDGDGIFTPLPNQTPAP